MTRIVVKPEASSRQVATIYAHVAKAALSLRAAIDAAEGLLPVASVVVLERLRQRASAVAHELEGPFLGRESSAPFADRLDPRAWLRWLDGRAGQGSDGHCARSQARAGAGHVADGRSLEP